MIRSRLHQAAWFLRDYASFLAAGSPLPAPIEEWMPCLDDRTSSAAFDRHYVYHTSWAARILAQTRPSRHVDIGSSLFFVGIASAFVPLEHYDYRPPPLALPGLTVGEAVDLNALPFATGSLPSVSCMHVVEHVGLGRYGDAVDPRGHRHALAELDRVVAPGGQLLIVVPVGRPRVCFNAHRIFAPTMISACLPGCTLERLTLIPDHPQDGGLVEAPSDELCLRQQYGCGCFLYRKQ